MDSHTDYRELKEVNSKTPASASSGPVAHSEPLPCVEAIADRPKCTEDILSLLRGRRIAIVGNATPKETLGEVIDGYDVVIRLNNYKLAGFEKLIGAKTDYRCTTGWKDIEHRNEHLEFSPFTAASAESANLEAFNRNNGAPLLVASTDVHPLVPGVCKPSTGCALVALCAHLGLEVDLFAFDGFKTAHYWEKTESFFTTHSGTELRVMLELPGVRLYGDDTDNRAAETAVNVPAPAFHIKPGYQSRPAPQYFADSVTERSGFVWQPDVYPLAAILARRRGLQHLIDVGCGRAQKLAESLPEFFVTGIDYGENLRFCREHYNFGQWIEANLEQEFNLAMPKPLLRQSLVICSDVIEHLVDPARLLRSLRRLLESVPALILSTPERDLVRGANHCGPPPNKAHVREWNLEELRCLLQEHDFAVNFIGLTRSNTRTNEMKTILSVLTREPVTGLLEQGTIGDAVLLEGTDLRFSKPPPSSEPSSDLCHPGSDTAGLQCLDQLLRHGQELITKGNIAAAIQELEQAADLAPQDADLMVCLGDLHAANANIERARRFYSRALTIDSGHPEAGKMLVELTVGDNPPAVGASRLAAKPAKPQTPQPPFPPGQDSKESHELAYWIRQKTREGTLANGHYEYFYTEHFGLDRAFFAGKRILDIGCGPRGSLEWADMAAERVGLDPLAERYSELGADKHKMRYVAAPSEAIPFPNGHFDVITSFNSLDHVADLEQTIREIIRVLKSDGLFLLLTDVNHSPTPCEPVEFSWDVVRRFEPHFQLVEQRHFEKPEQGGLYLGVKSGVAYDHRDLRKRYGILSARFRKAAGVFTAGAPGSSSASRPTPANGCEPHASPQECRSALRNQTAFAHLLRGFDLLKERKFPEAQAACREYQELIDYDALSRTDNRAEGQPKVSVVIVAYKIGQGLIQCIDSLAASENPPHEIIVVDNGGNDDIAGELARRPLLHIRVGANVILAEGRNIGVHFARAPYVSFVDDDAIAAKGYLAAVVEAFEAFDIHAFRGKVLPRTDHPHNQKARHYDMGDLPFPTDIDTEGNSAFRADTWRQLGGQDPLLFGGEGVELSYRIATKVGNYATIYWPSVVIHHDYAVTTTKLDQKNDRHRLMREYSAFKQPGLQAYHNGLLCFAQSESARRTGNNLIRRRARGVPQNDSSASALTRPFFSVCIPTYNRADFIEATLRSALEQTWSNYEIVVVDDGSTDGTRSVVQRFANDKIRSIIKEHSGGPATRNRCIAEARGDFILWLDSDDLILPRTLEAYAAELERDASVDVLYGDLFVFGDDKDSDSTWNYGDYSGWPEALVADTVLKNRIPNVCTLVRKSCYEKVGGYSEMFPRAHDYEFWTRLAPVAHFRHVHQVVGNYRVHARSLSRKGAADTSYEARAVQAMIARHDLRTLFPYCFREGLPAARSEAHAWLVAACLMLKYADTQAARDFVQRSIAAAPLVASHRLSRLLDSLDGVAVQNANATGGDHGSCPTSELDRLVETALQGWRTERGDLCAKACARMSELHPEAMETLLLTGSSLARWGHSSVARTAFECLVNRQTQAAYVDTAEAAEVAATESTCGSRTGSVELAELAAALSRIFGGETIPEHAVRDTLGFIAESARSADFTTHLARNQHRVTPLLLATLRLEPSQFGHPGNEDLLPQIERIRTGLARAAALFSPKVVHCKSRLPGYSFCIITKGDRPEKLARQIESIQALRIPNYEILIGGNVSHAPNGVAVVNLKEAALAGRICVLRNAVARQARFDHIIWSDDDIVFAPDFYKGLQRFGEDYGAMCVRIQNNDRTRFWDWVTSAGARGQVLLDYWESDTNCYVTGGFLVVKSWVYDHVSWNEAAGYYEGEDIDYTRRLRAAGIVPRFNAFCCVTHADDRYTRVGRKVMRFEHLLNAIRLSFECNEIEQAEKYLEAAHRLAISHPERCQALEELSVRFRPLRHPRALVRDRQPDSEHRPIRLAWEGSFLDLGSLSHVNRELSAQLSQCGEVSLTRVCNRATLNGCGHIPELRDLAEQLSPEAPKSTRVTIRHAWPPNWSPVQTGDLVVIQPWEYGALPAEWVTKSSQVREFWVPSEFVRRSYVNSGIPSTKVKIVPNGIDPERFNPGAPPMSLPTKKTFKFLFVGGTIHRKGPDLLLEAYLGSFTAQDDVCLVVKDFGGKSWYAGQTFEERIKAAQSRPNAPEILYLTDELPPKDIPGLYTACDCLAHPYRGEGFGLPILEAMACGLPVIVTAGGGADDFAREDFVYRIPARKLFIGREISGMKLTGEGWLLEPELKTLATHMRRVFENREEAGAKGKAAGEHVRREWTWEKAARIAAKNLQQLTAQPPAAISSSTRPNEKAAPIVLPACALVGHLVRPREFLGRKQYREAWDATVRCMQMRPFHPEACLLLAQIALAAGDSASARKCAQHAGTLAPDWKPVKRFLKNDLRGNAKHDWLVLPEAISGTRAPSNKSPRPYPRLTVCLIAKNEEQFIGQCLNSVRGIAGQIIVVDTGSTDRTVAIAKEHGAEVHSFAWCDDFSAARNAALEHATGDWVLVLDADEELAQDQHEALRKLLLVPEAIAWRLPIVDVGREDEGCSFVPRLFRNAPALFYVGRVHEQIFTSLEVRRQQWGLENRLGDATLRHHGYRPEIIKDRNKIERNLRLLERAIEELPDESNLLMNYGLELVRSGRKDEGLQQYRKAFEVISSRPPAEVVPETLETLLLQFTSQLLGHGHHDEIIRVLTSPLAKSRELSASLHFTLGLAHLELKQFREAADQMRQCLSKRDQKSLAPINKEVRKAGPRHLLALCLDQLGEVDAAAEEFRLALQDDPAARPVRFDRARFLAAHDKPVDALNLFFALSSEHPEDPNVWLEGGAIALSRPEFLEVARDWTAEAQRHAPDNVAVLRQRAEALTLSGDCATALPLWRRLVATQDPACMAALVICEARLGDVLFSPPSHLEQSTSREFARWYQRLTEFGAQQLLERLNSGLEGLRPVLPTAARMIEAAMAEAAQPASA